MFPYRFVFSRLRIFRNLLIFVSLYNRTNIALKEWDLMKVDYKTCIR